MRAWELKEVQNTGFQIYCDMDGVLVDFARGVTEFMADPQYGEQYVVQGYVLGTGKISAPFWKKLTHVNRTNPEEAQALWANLNWMPDGKKLWNYIKGYNPTILSSPGTTSRDIIVGGKRTWLDNHLGLSPDRYIFDIDKENHAIGKAGIQHILIDDKATKINPWVGNNGIGILHISAANTIKELKKWGL